MPHLRTKIVNSDLSHGDTHLSPKFFPNNPSNLNLLLLIIELIQSKLLNPRSIKWNYRALSKFYKITDRVFLYRIFKLSKSIFIEITF